MLLHRLLDKHVERMPTHSPRELHGNLPVSCTHGEANRAAELHSPQAFPYTSFSTLAPSP